MGEGTIQASYLQLHAIDSMSPCRDTLTQAWVQWLSYTEGGDSISLLSAFDSKDISTWSKLLHSAP